MLDQTTALLLALGSLLVAAATVRKMAAETAKLRLEVAAMSRELRPNGGTSTKDIVTRTETRSVEHSAALDAVTQRLDTLTGTVDEVVESVANLAAVDEADRARARVEHARLWRALQKKPRRRHV